MNPEFWRGKKVLLTGHTGFKGCWLSMWLHQLGAQLQGYALEPETTPDLFSLAGIEQDIRSVIADIRDVSTVEKSMREFQPEIVIHMAAQPLVRRSYREPLETLQTNIMGTANVLQAARKSEALRAVLVVTSDKCYKNDDHEKNTGFVENEPMGGGDIYSASKGCAELVTDAFRHSFFPVDNYKQHGVVIASARAGNVYGGGDWADDRLIPDAIRAIQQHKCLQVRYPQAIRPWQFVLEPLHGYLELIEQMVEQGTDFTGGWNFGPDCEDEISVQEVLAVLQTIFGKALQWEQDQDTSLPEAGYLRLNTNKSRQQLNWCSCWNLQLGLEKTAEWYQAVLADKSCAREISLKQLQDYQNSCLTMMR